MSHFLALTLLAFFLPSICFGFKPGLVIKKISEDTYLATDKDFYNSNTLVTKMKDGTVFIASSPYDTIGTKNLIQWINSELSPRKIVAVNTHYHFDGTGGNAIFHRKGVETWSSDLTTKLMKSDAPEVKKIASKGLKDSTLKARVDGTELIAAKNTFKLNKGKTFNFGGESIKVFFPGHAHSPDNLIVYFKDRKLMFGGCMIKTGKNLGWMRDAKVKTWVKAATSLLKYDVTTVIPGHGKIGGKELIYKTIATAKRTLKNAKKLSSEVKKPIKKN